MFWERFVDECSRIGKKPNSIRQELGVSSGTISNWKTGALPKIEQLNKVAAFFGVSTDYLLGKTDKRTAPELISEAGLSETELEYLRLIRTAPQYAREAALALLESAERASQGRDAAEADK